ncbi:MAG: twin-arginine translocation signal domain-containing protein, partial [Bacteroidota bacterium]
MSHCNNYEKQYTRRDFLSKTSLGLGAAALGTLLTPSLSQANTPPELGAG